MATQTDKFPASMQILRKPVVCKLLGFSTATLDRKRAEGKFPAPKQMGDQAVGWTLESIQTWLDDCPMASHFVEALW